jgi:hypothetical protein
MKGLKFSYVLEGDKILLLKQTSNSKTLCIEESYIIGGRAFKTIVNSDLQFNKDIEKIIVKAKLDKDCNFLFSHLKELRKVDLLHADCTEVEVASGMFKECHRLEEIKMPKTGFPNLKIATLMFFECSSLRTSKSVFIKSDKLEDASMMFYGCKSLNYISLYPGIFSNLRLAESMMEKCYNLKEVIYSNEPYSSVKKNTGWKYNDKPIVNIEEIEPKDSEVTVMESNTMRSIDCLFSGCKSLEKADIRPFLSDKITSLNEIFCCCTRIDEINMGVRDLSNIQTSRLAFVHCDRLKKLILPNKFSRDLENTLRDLDRDVNLKRRLRMTCKELVLKDTSVVDENLGITYRTYGSKLYVLDATRLCSIVYLPNKLRIKNRLYNVYVSDKTIFSSRLESVELACHLDNDCRNLFADLKYLKKADLSNAFSNELNYLNRMFAGCINLIKVKLPKAIAARDMSEMFSNCIKLKNLDLGCFESWTATNTSLMFHDCESLKSIDLSTCNFIMLENADNMFAYCDSLETVKLPLDCMSLVSMSEMFYFCKNLKRVKLPSILTNLEYSYRTFYGCESLTELTGDIATVLNCSYR